MLINETIIEYFVSIPYSFLSFLIYHEEYGLVIKIRLTSLSWTMAFALFLGLIGSVGLHRSVRMFRCSSMC